MRSTSVVCFGRNFNAQIALAGISEARLPAERLCVVVMSAERCAGEVRAPFCVSAPEMPRDAWCFGSEEKVKHKQLFVGNISNICLKVHRATIRNKDQWISLRHSNQITVVRESALIASLHSLLDTHPCHTHTQS